MTVLLSLSSISLFEGSKNAARQSHIHLLLNSKDLGRSSEQRSKQRRTSKRKERLAEHAYLDLRANNYDDLTGGGMEWTTE